MLSKTIQLNQLYRNLLFIINKLLERFKINRTVVLEDNFDD